MYLPPVGMPEWIEIVNNSPITIPLNGWKVSDGGSTKAAILPSGKKIEPGIYCILTTDTNAFKNFYSTPVQLLQASFSSLNNGGDAIVLFDQTNSVIDTLSYLPSWGGSTGRSLERVDTAMESSLQTNWRTSIHQDGATPGTINSVTPKQHDAALTRITTDPLYPIAEKECEAIVTVRNIGKERLSKITVLLYHDINADSLETIDELILLKNIPDIEPGDSTNIRLTIPSLAQGVHRIAATIRTERDDDSTNNTLFYSFVSGLEPYSIVITEILYAPAGDIPEWIEGYNRTSTSVTLDGWKISDNGSTKAPLIGGWMVIPPHSYFIITTDTAQFLATYQQNVQTFQGSFSSLNNTTPDAVVLYDERGGRMDSIFYHPSWGGQNGTTLQRFDTELFSADSSNWRSSLPSPGKENSVARKDVDAEIARAACTRSPDGISVRATVRNTGRNVIEGITVRIYHDAEGGGNVQHSEILTSEQVTFLSPNDSAVISFDWKTPLHGKQKLIVTCELSGDERIENNTGYGTSSLTFPQQSFVINEIMYEPIAGNAEFVELMNRSTDTVDVVDWKLLDQPSSSGSRATMMLSDSVLRIPPNGFLVIASDSSFFAQYPDVDRQWIVIRNSLSLSNSGEDIVLGDLTGTQIDSVHYSPQWHLRNIAAAGRSLERINPSLPSNDGKNWSSSTSHQNASPLRVNSIYTATAAAHSSISLSPNPFSPDNDGFEDFISINYSLPTASSMIRIRIFDVTGRLIRRLVQNEPSPSSGSIIWNGLDDDGHSVRIGMYIVLLEALDNFGGTARTIKDVAVVARRL